VCHGIEKLSAARTTLAGPGSRYSRIFKSGGASCQITSNTAKSRNEGAWR